MNSRPTPPRSIAEHCFEAAGGNASLALWLAVDLVRKGLYEAAGRALRA
jgi:hypothetical protein